MDIKGYVTLGYIMTSFIAVVVLLKFHVETRAINSSIKKIKDDHALLLDELQIVIDKERVDVGAIIIHFETDRVTLSFFDERGDFAGREHRKVGDNLRLTSRYYPSRKRGCRE